MSSKGYVDMGALKTEISKLCKSFGLPGVEVKFTDDRTGVTVKTIEVQHRQDIDPTEDSNAVCWGDN